MNGLFTSHFVASLLLLVYSDRNIWQCQLYSHYNAHAEDLAIIRLTGGFVEY